MLFNKYRTTFYPFLRSFSYAFSGLLIFFRHERNGKIQLLMAGVVVVLAWGLRVSATEWMILVTCIATVLSLEMMNTAIEKLCDMLHPEYHPVIKKVKDIAAGAVLLVSITSAIIGLVVFLPKVFQ